MNNHILIIYTSLSIFCSANLCLGTILDSFNQGEIRISSDFWASPNQRAFFEPESSGWPDFRMVRGSGAGFWNATVSQETGFLEYNFDFDGGMPDFDSVKLDLVYSDNFPDTFSLGDVYNFSLKLESVVGAGELIVTKNEPGLGDGANIFVTDSIQFSQPGTLLIPVTQSDLSGINLLRFTVTPKTSEFSFRLDEISVIPEPTTWSLLLLGGAPWAWRRVKRLAKSEVSVK